MEHLVELARRARGGDRAALEALLAESAGLAHAAARARLGDGFDAEAAAVAALARVARGLPRLRDARAYPHWLYRIAARCAADVRSAPGGAGPALSRADAARGPVDTLVAAERAQRVRAAIAALPVRLREPVVLHYVEGLAYRAMADLLGVGLGTIARRMRRAHDLLRRRLRADDGNGGDA